MKRSSFFVGILGVTFAATAAFVGCASFQADICAYGVCKEGDGSVVGDGSSERGLPDTNVPGCPNNAERLANPDKCFDEVNFVYVNAAVAEDGDGTKARPFKSIGKALSTQKAIVIAEGEYKEQLDISRPVEVFGGLAPDFAKVGAETRIAPGSRVGLNVSSEAVLHSISVRSENATTEGESSIGILVAPSGKFSMIAGTVAAGDGFRGKDGATEVNYDSAITNDNAKVRGFNAVGTAGGDEQLCTGYCTNTMSVVISGGAGGRGTSSPTGGGPGKTGIGGGAGALGTPNCGNGDEGATGENANGASGADVPLRAENGILVSTFGGNGSIAKPGQGGGGGGGSTAASGGGGGGGCGGCGGGRGTGGQSGGSSIGIAALGTIVRVSATVIVTGAAGAGGRGGNGQPGQAGGLRGDTEAVDGNGCRGGNGGSGGNGGGGGGGSGGYSVSVAYRGSRPELTFVPRFPSGPASAGGAGTGTGTVLATAGKVGANQAELVLQ